MTKKNARLASLLLIILTMMTGQAYANPEPEILLLPCQEPGPQYYAIDLVTTKKIPGTGQASGKAFMMFNSSPFGISISRDGSYQHKFDIVLEKVKKPKTGQFVAWATTTNLDQIKLIGPLNDDLEVSGGVEWNKYLVVITLENETADLDGSWKGPIAFRGISRSGLMHTMAGHGPFNQEPCVKPGFK